MGPYRHTAHWLGAEIMLQRDIVNHDTVKESYGIMAHCDEARFLQGKFYRIGFSPTQSLCSYTTFTVRDLKVHLVAGPVGILRADTASKADIRCGDLEKKTGNAERLCKKGITEENGRVTSLSQLPKHQPGSGQIMQAVHMLAAIVSFVVFRAAGVSQQHQLSNVHETGCYIHLETAEGYLDSPNYPGTYPPGFDCCYDIARPSPNYCGVKFYVETLNILKTEEDGAFCLTDWLAVESCVPEGGSRYCGNLTGTTLQYMFQPGSRALRLQFHSSDHKPDGEELRYRLRYRLLTNCRGLFQEPSVSSLPGPTDVPCYTKVRDKRGAIKTPHYPAPYPPYLDCVYEFIRPNPFICGIRMRSVTFELEPSVSTPFGGACSDFFQTPGCGFLCGSLNFSWLALYQPGATSQRFHFHSDEENSFPGFLIAFEQVYHCQET
ncbi:suppressor of tumorigenicity 14 protein homolog [Anabrus simplex]|uniref:suppressor of tumorigenicity 14 protein homolog n=1 Tax=Anabrus simplex TaxID=316456 RepID=UPI0035A3CBC5